MCLTIVTVAQEEQKQIWTLMIHVNAGINDLKQTGNIFAQWNITQQ